MITFAQALAENEDIEKHILLGNGFSQAWKHEIFNYKYLFNDAFFGEKDEIIKSIFEKFGTYDFETVMYNMLAAADVLECYGGDKQTITSIRADAETLKETLITVIAKNHPPKTNSITNDEYEMVRHFLFEFSNIFTLNYDLLMYWARNQSEIQPLDFNDTDDGFRYPLSWQGHRDDVHQSVFFLHGGLHIYDTDLSIKKHAYNEDKESGIVEQVKNNLSKNHFPLFVSEPTYQKKKQRIIHNPYLDYCFRQIRSLENVLFIYGHSFDISDKHIFDEIKESNINKIYISIYGDNNSEINQRTIANARTFLGTKNLVFYKAETTPIWR